MQMSKNKENVSSNRASEGKTQMRETLESYRRTKNMLKDLSKNIKPKATTQRLTKEPSREKGLEVNDFVTRNAKRDLEDDALINTTDER